MRVSDLISALRAQFDVTTPALIHPFAACKREKRSQEEKERKRKNRTQEEKQRKRKQRTQEEKEEWNARGKRGRKRKRNLVFERPVIYYGYIRATKGTQ